MKTEISAEKTIEARPEVVYHCLADYREHHNPSGFLPSAFSNFKVTRGGLGAGTEANWDVTTGGRTRSVQAVITEPEPGRGLVETGNGVITTFTVEPTGEGARVRFDTVIDDRGLTGLMTRLFAATAPSALYR